jgi:hypothetical protein
MRPNPRIAHAFIEHIGPHSSSRLANRHPEATVGRPTWADKGRQEHTKARSWMTWSSSSPARCVVAPSKASSRGPEPHPMVDTSLTLGRRDARRSIGHVASERPSVTAPDSTPRATGLGARRHGPPRPAPLHDWAGLGRDASSSRTASAASTAVSCASRTWRATCGGPSAHSSNTDFDAENVQSSPGVRARPGLP